MKFKNWLGLLALPLLCGAYPSADPYYHAMLKASLRERAGKPWDARSFSLLDWVGRTAALNHACQPSQDEEACRGVVLLGLTDRALLVRDHALRIAFHGSLFSAERKQELARQAIADTRNYRQGFGLWIVERAKEQLASKLQD